MRGRSVGAGVVERTMIRQDAKEGFHARNRFRGGYDFRRLAALSARLARHVQPNAHGDESIDFADPAAVRALNAALLQDAYAISGWDVPAGSLCPGVPGRSDQVHHVADLLAESSSGKVPRGPSVSVLDLCTGASCIVPLVGAAEYGWSFVGTDVDPRALRWATGILDANPEVSRRIELRLQRRAEDCFAGVVAEGETFDAVTCNPPFYSSASEAAEATGRKSRNLGRAPVRNFGGRPGELWCEGGELGFVKRMIAQSARRPRTFLWLTSLVSRSQHLRPLEAALRAARAAEVRIVPLVHGRKTTRLLAWTFLSTEERVAWSRRRTRR
jgi:23S rRNA (adenine1618-N6)-methyltransferase